MVQTRWSCLPTHTHLTITYCYTHSLKKNKGMGCWRGSPAIASHSSGIGWVDCKGNKNIFQARTASYTMFWMRLLLCWFSSSLKAISNASDSLCRLLCRPHLRPCRRIRKTASFSRWIWLNNGRKKKKRSFCQASAHSKCKIATGR